MIGIQSFEMEINSILFEIISTSVTMNALYL